MKLTIELVPKTCWYSNVRSEVTPAAWDKIKRIVSTAANNVCEICGGRGPKWPTECHEVWKYDDTAKTQTLIKMCALCPSCHEVKHIGLAQVKGRGDIAIEHLMKVNSLSRLEAQNYVDQSFRIWAARSIHQWKLDLTSLAKYA